MTKRGLPPLPHPRNYVQYTTFHEWSSNWLSNQYFLLSYPIQYSRNLPVRVLVKCSSSTGEVHGIGKKKNSKRGKQYISEFFSLSTFLLDACYCLLVFNSYALIKRSLCGENFRSKGRHLKNLINNFMFLTMLILN